MDSLSLSRRDLLEACRLAGVGMQKIETDPEGQLALTYMVEKRAGETHLSYDDWLDEDLAVEVSQVLEKPSGNASRDEWAAYADQEGVEYSKSDGRNDIRDAVEAAEGDDTPS